MKDAPAKVGNKSRADRRTPEDQTICQALKHPIRVRILEALCEEDMSPIRFLRRGLLPPGFDFEGDEKNALSHIAYHFKALLKADCIVLTEVVPRRGAGEHVYQSKMLALHTDEDFEVLDLEHRRQISRSTTRRPSRRRSGHWPSSRRLCLGRALRG